MASFSAGLTAPPLVAPCIATPLPAGRPSRRVSPAPQLPCRRPPRLSRGGVSGAGNRDQRALELEVDGETGPTLDRVVELSKADRRVAKLVDCVVARVR